MDGIDLAINSDLISEELVKHGIEPTEENISRFWLSTWADYIPEFFQTQAERFLDEAINDLF